MADGLESELQRETARRLEEIGRTFMPFGKFGPEHYPPHGVPIYDLPAEYLQWFAVKGGWPRGLLGELLKTVYQAKADGLDLIFDPLRKRNGGPTELRKARTRKFSFQ